MPVRCAQQGIRRLAVVFAQPGRPAPGTANNMITRSSRVKSRPSDRASRTRARCRRIFTLREDAEPVRDIRAGESMEIVQQQDLPLRGRQVGQEAEHAIAHVSPLQQFVGAERHLVGEGRTALSAWGHRGQRRAPVLALPEVVVAEICANALERGFQRGGLLQPREASVRAGRFLRDIVGSRSVADQAEGRNGRSDARYRSATTPRSNGPPVSGSTADVIGASPVLPSLPPRCHRALRLATVSTGMWRPRTRQPLDSLAARHSGLDGIRARRTP